MVCLGSDEDSSPGGAGSCLVGHHELMNAAVDGVKEAIPRVLYIKGHNPFTLLHGALSEGIHAASDGECLVAANDIRLILVELAERLNEALREQRELDAALSRLVNRRN